MNRNITIDYFVKETICIIKSNIKWSSAFLKNVIKFGFEYYCNHSNFFHIFKIIIEKREGFKHFHP